MNKFYLKMRQYLFILFIALFFVTTSNAQHPIPPDRNYIIAETLYSANAQELASDWISDDFFLDDEGRYSTGPYPPNANMLTKSTPIELPALEENQKIILQVKGSFWTEYVFDFILISISTDEGENFKRIAIRTGRNIITINWDEDFDLSEFSGKEIIISLNLISDEDYEHEGVSLDSICVVLVQPPGSVFLHTEKAYLKKLLLYPNPAIDMLYLNKDAYTSIDYIEVYDINGQLLLRQQGDKNAIKVDVLSSGIYYLRAKDTNGNTYNQSFTKK